MSRESPLLQHPTGEESIINRSDDMTDNGTRWKDSVKVFLVSLLLVVGGISLTLIILLRQHSASDEYDVVFDAGSSHTALYVYKWAADERMKGTAVPVDEVFNNETLPGISSYAEHNASEAGESLKGLIQQALNVVPLNIRSSTPVYLGATAGMRLVEKVNSTISDQIMSSIRQVLLESGFKFAEDHAKIIKGEDEGAFGWITVNYLKKVFQETSKHVPSAGALDLGGASTQISFVSANSTNSTDHLRLFGKDYPVYTKTYLCYGENEIYRRFLAELAKNSNYKPAIPNPCAPASSKNVTKNGTYLWDAPCSCQPSPSVNHSFTFYGAIDSKECTKQVARLFTFNNTCPEATVFSRGDQPSLTGNFIAFSGYYYAAKDLGLPPSPTIKQFKSAYEKVCNKTMIEEKASLMGNMPVCFTAQYVYALLTQGYGFDNQTWQITFKKTVDKKSVGWTLGYMINATNLIPLTQPQSNRLRNEIYMPVLVVSIIFILGGFLLCANFIRRKRRSELGYSPI